MSIVLQLFLTFLKVGLVSFGGGMAIVAVIYDEIQKFAILSAEQFANIVAISQATPGPVAVNVATYIGYVADKIPGSIVATIGVTLPSFVIIIIVCKLVGNRLDNKYIKGALSGVRPATVGMIASSFIVLVAPALFGDDKIGTWFDTLPFDPIACVIFIATIVLVGKFKKSPIKVLILMGCIGAILSI